MKRLALACLVFMLPLSMTTFYFPALSRAEGITGWEVAKELTGSAYEGRQTGTPGYVKAVDYMESVMRQKDSNPLALRIITTLTPRNMRNGFRNLSSPTGISGSP